MKKKLNRWRINCATVIFHSQALQITLLVFKTDKEGGEDGGQWLTQNRNKQDLSINSYVRGPYVPAEIDIVAIVAKTVKIINRKTLNVIVSELPETGQAKEDSTLFSNLSDNFLSLHPSVVNSTRLRPNHGATSGIPVPSRPRLLMVTLSSAALVDEIVRAARL